MGQSHNLMRSLLFVPGNQPERFYKARQSGADVYCIDLEDAVPAAEKEVARIAAIEHVIQRQHRDESAPLAAIRINSLSTLAGIKDLMALAEPAVSENLRDCIIMLPMAECAFEIRQIAEVISGAGRVKIMPLIETPGGIDNLDKIIDASDQIVAVGFGTADFTAITGSELSWEALLFARSRIVETTNVRGVHCFDGPWFDIVDTNGLATEVQRVARLGFGGKLAIHPSQVDVINQSFVPEKRKVQWAIKVIDAWENSGGGVVDVDGVMVDRPVVKRARRVLTLANIVRHEE